MNLSLIECVYLCISYVYIKTMKEFVIFFSYFYTRIQSNRIGGKRVLQQREKKQKKKSREPMASNLDDGDFHYVRF